MEDRKRHEISEEDDSYVWRSFTINISFVVLLFILLIFAGIFINNERLIQSELETRARSYFKNIVLTRKWNALYGGVYAGKRPGDVSNPYLDDPDMRADDGTVYTMKNPALMTREISELAEKEGGVQFHITSLNLLNPNNAPDEFEKESLRSFENGENEAFYKERSKDKVFFRYMAPLYVEESCLICHAKQGYKTGDVRGGISVKFEITGVEKEVTANRYILPVLFITTVALLIGIIYSFIIKLRRKLLAALEKIKAIAITNELTRLYNRRYFSMRLDEECRRSKRYNHPLGCIIMDLDFFKNINDTYGHKSGDMVLQAVSRILKESCRDTDVVARYGGEEFIEMLPETGLETTIKTAERIRSLIASTKIVIDEDREVSVTASFGVVSVSPEDWDEYPDYHEVIKAADRALYRAKDKGRNRVEVA